MRPMVSFEAGEGTAPIVCAARTRFITISAVRISPGRKRPMLPSEFEPMTAVYTSEDGTVYDSTDGWRIENYGSDKILAREVGGTLDAEIAKGKSRTDILIPRATQSRALCVEARTQGLRLCGGGRRGLAQMTTWVVRSASISSMSCPLSLKSEVVDRIRACQRMARTAAWLIASMRPSRRSARRGRRSGRTPRPENRIHRCVGVRCVGDWCCD